MLTVQYKDKLFLFNKHFLLFLIILVDNFSSFISLEAIFEKMQIKVCLHSCLLSYYGSYAETLYSTCIQMRVGSDKVILYFKFGFLSVLLPYVKEY